MAARRSSYHFDPGPLPLERLAGLLHHALGPSRRVAAHGRPDHPLSRSPSAGGLNSVQVSVAATRVHPLAPGVYRYDLDGHRLLGVTDGDPRSALASCYVQREFADACAATVVLSARLGPALERYPPRHYRTLHVDAGIAVQSLYLVATALELACCAVAGYHDEQARRLVRAADDEVVTVLVALGKRQARVAARPVGAARPW